MSLELWTFLGVWLLMSWKVVRDLIEIAKDD